MPQRAGGAGSLAVLGGALGLVLAYRHLAALELGGQVVEHEPEHLALALVLGSASLMLSAQEQPAPPPPPPEAELPEKITLPPAPEEAPTVNIRQIDNGDTVEEYRQNGRIFMVKVTPSRGPAYYLMDTDGNGRLNRENIADGVAETVSPVYWTLYEWD